MTLCAVWSRLDATLGRQIVMATDSRITGGLTYDHGTKLSVFNRRDCALCWHGDTTFSYAFTVNARNDIDFSDNLSARGTGIDAVAERLLRIFNLLWDANLNDPHSKCKDDHFAFIFAGYDYRLQDVKAWTYEQDPKNQQRFRQKQISDVTLAAGYFAGSDPATAAAQQFMNDTPGVTPYAALRTVISDPLVNDVGGYPQVVTIDRRGTEVVGVVDNGQRYLFGKLVNSSGHWTQTRYIDVNAPGV